MGLGQEIIRKRSGNFITCDLWEPCHFNIKTVILHYGYRRPWNWLIFIMGLFILAGEYPYHYNDVIMTTMTSQIASLTVVYSTVYSDADQRKHQSSASLAFVWGIHRDRWIPRTEGQLRGKCFHLMTSSCIEKVTPGAQFKSDQTFQWFNLCPLTQLRGYCGYGLSQWETILKWLHTKNDPCNCAQDFVVSIHGVCNEISMEILWRYYDVFITSYCSGRRVFFHNIQENFVTS